MTFDAFPAASQELETDALKETESASEEEAALEIVTTTEDPELEDPVPVVPDTDDQEGNDDPISLYLHQIGQVPLLTSCDEKIAARQIEIGKRISEIKWELEKQGKQAVAGQVFQEIVLEL